MSDDTTTDAQLLRRARIQREINEPILIGNAVVVGDRFRFTFDAARFILNEPASSTVVVVLAEIVVEDDGAKRLVVVPE